MCTGGAALDLIVFSAIAWLAPAGFVARSPEISMAIIALNATAAMAAYMVARAHPLQHNVEMSAGSIVGGIGLVAAFWLGAIPAAKFDNWLTLFSFMCGPLCFVMFLVMVVRFDHYGGRVGASAAAGTSSATGEYTCSMHPEVRLAGPERCPDAEWR